MSLILVPIWFFCGIIVVILAWLRWRKGQYALSSGEKILLPHSPSCLGIIRRLDGIERHNRIVSSSSRPLSRLDGSLDIPLISWDKKPMTVARFASIAHTWALAQMAESDPSGHIQRERAIAQARIIPILTLFLCIILCAAGRISPSIGITLVFIAWVLPSLIAIPSQFREWKAIAIAKTGLKNAQLYPQDLGLVSAINKSLTALAWCRVAGMKQIVPK